jgi:hypothetical protein
MVIIISDSYRLPVNCWPFRRINVAHSSDHPHAWLRSCGEVIKDGCQIRKGHCISWRIASIMSTEAVALVAGVPEVIGSTLHCYTGYAERSMYKKLLGYTKFSLKSPRQPSPLSQFIINESFCHWTLHDGVAHSVSKLTINLDNMIYREFILFKRHGCSIWQRLSVCNNDVVRYTARSPEIKETPCSCM